MDTALEAERVEAIRRTILEVEGVESLHQLRTRRMGGAALVDVHIQVDPRISVTEGHQIGEAVRQRLMDTFEDISDVTVHIDPEDDEKAPLNLDLPLRRTLLRELQGYWKDVRGASLIRRVNLHYLGGKLHVELFLPCLGDPQKAGELASALEEATLRHPQVASVNIYQEGCTSSVHSAP
ncbi:MAG: hypothetical protein D6819_06555 [Gammaproteobacteria bacterium]|nr:MAG: hypothetical protein D6819_06555 [Gammaproteobacteria bacterium]